MKTQFLTVLTAVLGLSVPVLMSAGEHQKLLSRNEASQVVAGSAWHDKMAAFENILTGKGFRPEESFAAEQTSDSGNGQTLTGRIIVKPFINDSGEVATIIAFSSELQNGEAAEESVFYTTGKFGCTDCTDENQLFRRESNPAGAATTAAISSSDVEQLIQLIRIGNYSGIFNWIKGHFSLSPDAVLAPIVRYAYERNGYFCPNAPLYFPVKTWWYFATCARRVY